MLVREMAENEGVDRLIFGAPIEATGLGVFRDGKSDVVLTRRAIDGLWIQRIVSAEDRLAVNQNVKDRVVRRVVRANVGGAGDVAIPIFLAGLVIATAAFAAFPAAR